MMNENMSSELREACKHRSEEGRIHAKILQSTVDDLLKGKGDDFKLLSLMQSIRCQLHFLRYPKKAEPTEVDGTVVQLDGRVSALMQVLDMEKYYPQKFKYNYVTMLRADIQNDIINSESDNQNDVNKKPNSWATLPLYFITCIMALDSETRERCFVVSDDDSSDDESCREEPVMIHPLDLIYIVFLCCDDFLRQELADKMLKCQYAVPFVLPSPLVKDSCQKNLVLHWALKGIVRDFYHNNVVKNEPLADVEAPLVTCVSIGKEVAWQVKLLNKMLSPHQDTFWHKGLKGGHCNQKISQEMVEIAWYLPGPHGNNILPCPVTFTNIRKSVNESSDTCDALLRFSSICRVFVNSIDPELADLVQMKNMLPRLLLVVLYQDKEMKQKSKQLQETLKLEKHQLICKAMEEGNFTIVQEQLKTSIQVMMQLGVHKTSVSNFVMQTEKDDIFEVDDRRCYVGFMAAQSVLKEVDLYNVKRERSAKALILPCHSDLKSRREIAAQDKELCRQKELVDGTVQDHAYKVKKKKWKVQLCQLHIPISDTFRYFLRCLVGLHREDRKYFLQSLQLGLNKRSVQMLQPLYEQYEKCRVQDESSERNEKLKEIDAEISCGSLGVEHFFRELAVVYENLVAFESKSQDASDIGENLAKLAKCVAELITEGITIEILDSDSMDVPVSWLNAVFLAMENSSKSTLYKVSALGAQSSGKSTLLNAFFGCSFPVSSGRCTRGAYVQLVRVDDTLKEILKCDFVAVIDSEGLMSRTRFGCCDFDNELSTFIIGLSDLTLVFIKAEGIEMNDVIPIAIHVFLRMNIVGEHQACHFVHQTMGAVDAGSKGSTEIEAFVRDLDLKTLAAAKQAGKSDQYSKFTDVLQYKSTTDNTYVQSLWDGSPPMGKINIHYSRTVQKLKSMIVCKIKCLQSDSQKRLGTFVDLTKRLNELWDAVKYENFIFSFKNVLAVEAHANLTEIFDEEQWALKYDVDAIKSKERHTVKNEMQNPTKSLDDVIDKSEKEILRYLCKRVENVQTKIMHYFQCGGCGDCSSTVNNRHLLTNNRKEFHDEVRVLWTTLKHDVKSFMLNLATEIKTEEKIRQLSKRMDNILTEKLQEDVRDARSEDFTETEVEDLFEKLWRDFGGDISRMVRQEERNENIEAAVQMTIRNLLGSDSHFCLRLLTSQQIRSSAGNSEVSDFTVNPEKHMSSKNRFFSYIVDVTERDVSRLKVKTDRMIYEVKQYFKSPETSEGKQFNQRDAEFLIKDILDQIDTISDERFSVTDDYKIDFLHHIERLAVAGFTVLREKYCSSLSPEALLAKKKQSYKALFAESLGHGSAASKFCENVLKDMILDNLGEQISCTELLNDLREHCGNLFRDIKSLQSSIMIDLLVEDTFDSHLEYITNYRGYMKDKIMRESTEYFIKASRLKNMALDKLDGMIAAIREALENTVKSSCANKEFIQTFLRSLECQYSRTEAGCYLELEVQSQDQFKTVIERKLNSQVRETIVHSIMSWDAGKVLQRRGLGDFIFREIVGCDAVCPFCKVPCDAHCGGKTRGMHSSTLHRPQGLGGFYQYETEKLLINDCCICVASPTAEFLREDQKLEKKWTLYRNYQRIHPDWKICGRHDPDIEKYWKWVLMRHNSKFADHYAFKEAEIPREWSKYRKEEIVKDVEHHYNTKVDRSKLESKKRKTRSSSVYRLREY